MRAAKAGWIIPILFLAACATPVAKPEPQVVVQEVRVPVAVKCAADPGPSPVYADTDAAISAAPNIFEVAKLRMEGRAQRIAREIELLAANSGCR